MKNILLPLTIVLFLISCSGDKPTNEVSMASLSPSENSPSSEVAKDEKWGDYWYDGLAEISSYKLSQARYGDNYEGTSVLIFVTEQFLPKRQLKADNASDENIPVMKLNSTKNFLTGIYPYSLMSSVFTPTNGNKNAVKTTFSQQEWCGQTYVQLNNRGKYEISSHSYFESNGDKEVTLDKDALENDIWTKIRINPKELPLGQMDMIPSMEYLSMNHKPIKAYKVSATLVEQQNFMIYTLDYPELKRTLKVQFTREFPNIIESWEESFHSSRTGSTLTTKVERMKTIKSDYWSKNGVGDEIYRRELGL